MIIWLLCLHQLGKVHLYPKVTTGLLACFHKLNHLGLRNVPRRSTLSDANSRRSSLFFQNVYHELYNYYYRNSPDSLEEKDVKKRLFLVDSTTISLFNEVMKGMGTHAFNGRKKGGAKAYDSQGREHGSRVCTNYRSN
ncbi:MAG: hypothetical protein IPF46_14445 [Saprospiraceae bacterium]|nr:hypothetical protein [Candidatus Vicinibacter affinis]